ncbi:MAG: YpiF family protein [Bacillus sp. (in: firmicutes)]
MFGFLSYNNNFSKYSPLSFIVLGENDIIILVKLKGWCKDMKWTPQDIETYLNAKEYVDTAVVPLLSVSMGGEMKQSAAAAEFITLLTGHLERQFTGRLLLLPPFTYLKSKYGESTISVLKDWEADLIKGELKHVFYITSEIDWRKQREDLTGTVIWLPSIPLEHMTDSQKLAIVDSQVKQLLDLFTQKWHENE